MGCSDLKSSLSFDFPIQIGTQKARNPGLPYLNLNAAGDWATLYRMRCKQFGPPEGGRYRNKTAGKRARYR
jgi:hypothetical protein